MPITEELMMEAHQIGIKLESVGGLTVWEGPPVIAHQNAIFRIQTSIKALPGRSAPCDCAHYADLSLRFPDGSQKRPDISIFCKEPVEQWEEVTAIPDAVVEILSKGYEAKDMEVGVPFCLAQGVKDVVVLNPVTGCVLHFRKDRERTLESPVEIALECGCMVTV